MRLKQYINELSMKKGTRISTSRVNSHTYSQKITLEDGTYFYFNGYGRLEDGEWEISFEDEDYRMDIRPKDKGIALQLFAALEQVFKEFVKKTNPKKIFFTSYTKDKSRTKLYITLLKKIASKTEYKPSHETGLSTQYFILTK